MAMVLPFKNQDDGTVFVQTDKQTETAQGPTERELMLSIATQFSGVQNQLDNSTEQLAYLVQLFEQNRAKQGFGTTTSYSYLSPIVFKTFTNIDQRKKLQATEHDEAETVPQVALVALHRVLEFGAVLLAFVCLAGLSSWLLNDSPLVSPFAAILGLLAAPFFYLMGRVAR